MKKSQNNQPPHKTKVPLYLSLLIIAALIGCFFTIPSFNRFCVEAWQILTSKNESQIQNWVEGFGWFGPLLIVVAMVLQMFLIVIPTLLLMIVAVLAYGPFWGSVISYISVFIASSVAYAVGSYVGSGFIIHLLGGKAFEKLSRFLKEYGFWAVAITRITPFLSNDAISFVAGILKMRYIKFMSATILGISPLILLIAFTGTNSETLTTGLLWGSLASVLIFVSFVFWDRRRKSAV